MFVAAGDGCILSGIYKGFTDMVRLTITARMPVVVAVQAEGSNALARAMETGRFDRRPSRTIADSISVDVPRNGRHALRLIQSHQGRIVTVTDEAILKAQAHLAGLAGLFTEPAGAAAWAGFLKIKAELPADAFIVVLLTGHGLKDTAAAAKGVTAPEKVIRSLDDLES